MVTQGEGVKLALDTHSTHLLPSLNRVHSRPAICIAVDEEHRCCVEVEVELWHKHCAVGIAACCVVCVSTIGEGVCRIDTNTPLHIAGLIVDDIGMQVGSLT